MNITITDGDVTIHPRRAHITVWAEDRLYVDVFPYDDPKQITSFLEKQASAVLDNHDRNYLTSPDRVAGDYYDVGAHDSCTIATIVFLP